MQYRDSAHAEYVAEQATKRANLAHVHYLWLSIGQAAHEDGGREIEGIVDDIVEAAVARVEKAIHAEREAHPIRAIPPHDGVRAEDFQPGGALSTETSAR